MGTILDLTTGAHLPRKSAPPSDHAIDSTPQAMAEREAKQRGADRQRLADELVALRKREQLVLQALAVIDHPELRAPIQQLKVLVDESIAARTQALASPSGAEQAEESALVLKLSQLQQQRSELDTQIIAAESEYAQLREQQLRARKQAQSRALEALAQAAVQHELTFARANVSMHALFPELAELGSEYTGEHLSILTGDINEHDVLDALEPPQEARHSTPPPLSARTPAS